ncbi:MAG: GtrA family protein [Sphingomonas sp.]|jgi:putative flippase GtrA
MAIFPRRIEQWRGSVLLGQLVRFGIAGGATSLIYIALYVPLTHYVFSGARAVGAVPLSFGVAVVCGFFLHSKWSFRGHGARSSGGWQQAKFVVVQASGLALNAIITWVGTALLGYPALVPLIPAIFLAAIVTFLLNRWWVFG